MQLLIDTRIRPIHCTKTKEKIKPTNNRHLKQKRKFSAPPINVHPILKTEDKNWKRNIVRMKILGKKMKKKKSTNIRRNGEDELFGLAVNRTGLSSNSWPFQSKRKIVFFRRKIPEIISR